MSAGLKKTVFLAALSAFFSTQVAAEDLGKIGPVWTIRERNVLDVIQEKMHQKEASGELNILRKQMTNRAQSYVKGPKNIGILRAVKARSFLFDPSVDVPYPIKNEKQELIYPAGQHVNPLNYISLSKRLVFLDAADSRQLDWLKVNLAKLGKVKIILTGGQISLAQTVAQQRIYFDQKGALVDVFEINAVPAIVSQEEKLLRIQEIVP